MARRRSNLMLAPRPTVIRQTRIVKAGRRVGGAIRAGAASEKHTIAAVAAAAILAFAKKQGVQLPKVETLGVSGTYGLILWAAGRFTKSQMLTHAATGLMSVAVAEMISGDRIMGDDGGVL